MKNVLATVLVIVLVLVGVSLAFVYSGIYDVSASTPDNPFIARLIHTISDRSVAARMVNNHPPADYDAPEKVAVGAHLFAENCTVCHGAPGVEKTAIAKGVNPSPPDLFRAGRKPDPAENFQFIKYGVKMTAMPAFGPSYSDEQIWSLVAFLNKLPGISPEEYAGLGATK